MDLNVICSSSKLEVVIQKMRKICLDFGSNSIVTNDSKRKQPQIIHLDLSRNDEMMVRRT